MVSVAGALLGVSFLRQISNSTIKKSKKIKLGPLSNFPADTYTLVENAKVFVYRDHEAVKAVSAVCTHLGCTIAATAEGFECPCHGSCYSKNGEVLSGPAPSSLSWYTVGKSPDGTIHVDMAEIAKPGDKFLLS
jgi:menaquinol-cytochrome c reductase iron-sulfur subunit